MQEQIREDFRPALMKLDELGYNLFATEETAGFLQDAGIPVTQLHWPEESATKSPNIKDYVEKGDLDLVFMFSNTESRRTETNYNIRRLAVDFGVPLITNLQVAQKIADAAEKLRSRESQLHVEPLRHYWDGPNTQHSPEKECQA